MFAVLSAMTSVPPSKSRSFRRRAWPIAILLLLAMPFLSACLRVQVSMAVSDNDRVSGQIVVAAEPKNDKDKGPQLKEPSSLGDRLHVQPYNRDGMVGSQVIFSDLNFGELSDLKAMSDDAAGKFELKLVRAGDLVALDGSVDLKGLPEEGTDVTFTMAFPARISTTNGTRVSDSVVSWRFTPGEVNTVRAEVRYTDPNTRSFAGWAGIVGGVAIGVALVIGAMAFLTRSPQAAGSAAAAAERAVQRLREKKMPKLPKLPKIGRKSKKSESETSADDQAAEPQPASSDQGS